MNFQHHFDNSVCVLTKLLQFLVNCSLILFPIKSRMLPATKLLIINLSEVIADYEVEPTSEHSN